MLAMKAKTIRQISEARGNRMHPHNHAPHATTPAPPLAKTAAQCLTQETVPVLQHE